MQKLTCGLGLKECESQSVAEVMEKHSRQKGKHKDGAQRQDACHILVTEVLCHQSVALGGGLEQSVGHGSGWEQAE